MTTPYSLNQRFDHLFRTMSTASFLKKEALGGEIPFFIAAYAPEEEVPVTDAIRGLRTKLANHGIPTLEINLYDLAMQLLDEELGLDEVFELEREMDKDEFKEALQSVLDLHAVFIPAVARRIEQKPEARIYFLTGIGQVYPFIRSHNILNNLQRIATDCPTVMFFPGEYDGKSLSLFGRLKDDNYYRAFNLDNYTP